MKDLIYKQECYQIQGAVFEVYKEMGNGFLEAVYQECLERELDSRDMPYISKKSIPLHYKRNKLLKTYRPDLICYGKIIVEIKSVSVISKEHQAQVLNYLKSTRLKLGLIMNFGAYPKVEIKRLLI
ncbi:GxxExxY protein [Chitinispirillales bacterium ANBcel5]|uniref:GxxExxY protein n=1 Tax=Cellulosispirillum alkaliphilum TaxID=3039283 RepID=UPI002A58BF35|nr:GxxExxY protein [Chitinispirillales bacterium ANBcel5]